MRVIFAGTPEFAAIALQALLDAGHTIPLVLTQPDRPAGRGMKLQASAVKQLALRHGVPVAQPQSLRLDGKYPVDAKAAQTLLAQTKADVMVVVAYGLLLPLWTLQTPRLGCLNIHASLLPRWRGAAPIHRAIEAGDAQTGITIMQMDEGLDTGSLLAQGSIPIAPHDTTQSLHDKLAKLGGEMIVQTLQQPNWRPQAQSEHGVTYAHKINKTESAIDLEGAPEVLARKIRAFNPAPGCTATLHGVPVKIWDAQVVNGKLDILQVQRLGGKRITMAEFLRGLPT